jgi:hypothetical protein
MRQNCPFQVKVGLALGSEKSMAECSWIAPDCAGLRWIITV